MKFYSSRSRFRAKRGLFGSCLYCDALLKDSNHKFTLLLEVRITSLLGVGSSDNSLTLWKVNHIFISCRRVQITGILVRFKSQVY